MRSLLTVLCLALPAAGEPRTDAHGDPLPDRAILRYGTIRDRVGGYGCLRAFALSPDGKWLAVEDSNDITLWDVDTGRPKTLVPWRYWQGHESLFDLSFSSDGTKLARVAGRLIQVLEVTSGKALFEHDLKEEGSAREVVFVPGTSRIAVTAKGKPESFVFDWTTGRRIATPKLGPAKLLSPVGRDYFGDTGEKSWVLLDGETGRLKAQFPRTAKALSEWWRFTPDGRRVCFLAAGNLRVFDTKTGKSLEDLEPPRGWDSGRASEQLSLSPDSSMVYVRQFDGLTHRWEFAARKWLDPLPAMTVGHLLPLPDRKRLLLIGDDGVLQRFDATTGRELPSPDGFRWDLSAVASPDGTRVAIASGAAFREGRLDLFDITGRHLWSLRPRSNQYGTPWWTPDGRNLACVGSATIALRDAATARLLMTMCPQWDLGLTRDAYFPPGRNELVAPYRQGGIHIDIFNLKTGERTGFVDTDAPVVDLSPDGRALLCVPKDGGLRLVDVRRGKVVAQCPESPDRNRWSVSPPPRFSPDGSFILSWEKEQAQAPTWAPKTFAVLRDSETLAVQRRFEAEEAEFVAFSPDSQWLALGKSSGRWVLYDIALGDCVGKWEGHRDKITSIGFVGLGRALTGSNDLTALLWDLQPKEKPTRPLWDALAGDDPREAYRAVWALSADSKVPELLRKRIKVAPAPPAEKVKQWLADLSANRFADREAATKGLQDLGRVVEPDLRAARDAATAAEPRARLDALLARIPRTRTSTEVIQARAVAAMELSASADARKLLAEWAAGAPGARLTIDAKAALDRIPATR